MGGLIVAGIVVYAVFILLCSTFTMFTISIGSRIGSILLTALLVVGGGWGIGHSAHVENHVLLTLALIVGGVLLYFVGMTAWGLRFRLQYNRLCRKGIIGPHGYKRITW